MKVFICGLSSLLFIIGLEAKHEFTQVAKDCVTEIKSDEDSLRNHLREDRPFPEDNDLVLKFFGCIYASNVNDRNELIVDDNLKKYITNILSRRIEGKKDQAPTIANYCIDKCKNIKGDSKGKTAVKVMNCIKENLVEYEHTEH